MVLRVRETFFYGNQKLSRGQLVRDDDPIARGKMHLFEPVPDDLPVVEQATAAPGEIRTVRRRRK
jgi:hypothetical protein